VLWLLTELGYRGTVSKSAFFEYVKSLRKLGIPFGHQTKRGKRLALYSYWHLIELATVLSLRVYHAVPDAVLRGIAGYRGKLYRLYQRAYAERRLLHRAPGKGHSTEVKSDRPARWARECNDVEI